VKIGRYRVGERLGDDVFAAHDPDLDRRIAIKLVDSPPRGVPRIAHGNVVTVFDVGEHEGRTFVVMERSEGTPLPEWVTGRRRRPQQIRAVLLQAAWGLSAIHAAGHSHGNLRASSILVEPDGNARVTDVGLTGTDDDHGDQRALCAIICDLLGDRRALRARTMNDLIEILSPKKRRLGLVAVPVIALAGVAVFAWSKRAPAHEPCTGAETRVARVWNPPMKAIVRASFDGTNRPFAVAAWQRVEHALDGYAHDWANVHVDACRATAVRKQQPPDVLDLRMQCLDERLAELEATVAMFAKPDASVVDRAARMAAELTPVLSCSDIAALRAPTRVPPRIRADVAALGETLARVRALDHADRFDEARPQAERAVARAIQLGFAPAEAEARFVAGALARRDGDLPTAERHLTLAVHAAEAGGDDRAKANALVELVSVHDTWNHDAEARDHATRAAATIARIGGDSRTQARLDTALGYVERNAGKPAVALAHYEKALAAYRGQANSEFDVASALENIGAIELELGKAPQAEEHLREAHAMMTKLVGGDHRHIATLLAELADALLAQEKADEAKRSLDTGLAIAERAHAPSESIAQILNALGSLALEQERAAEALAFVDRAYQLLGAANKKHTVLLNTVRLQGEALLALERYDAALAKFEQAKHLIIEKKGATNSGIAFADEAIAAAYEAQGKHADAVQVLEHALAIRHKLPDEHPDVARTRFALARAVAATGDKRRARSLAEQARAGFAAAKSQRDIDDIDAWLKSL